jgi:hypothetical protein
VARPPRLPHVRVDPFWLIELLSLPLLLYWGRNAWFSVDDWDFLAHRTAGTAGDLLRAHDQHWTTLPVLIYRMLWSVFGLRYTPYLVVLVVLHLAVAALLRELMRRAGVRPWLATLTAVLFIFFGAGSEDILSAFQMTVVASLCLGLVQLVLIDHEGPFGRRDAVVIAVGVAAVMSSGIGAAMIFTTGIAAWLRRGWRIAVGVTALPAASYLLWFAAVGSRDESGITRPSPADVVKFVGSGFAGGVGAIANVDNLGWVVGAVLVAGSS